MTKEGSARVFHLSFDERAVDGAGQSSVVLVAVELRSNLAHPRIWGAYREP